MQHRPGWSLRTFNVREGRILRAFSILLLVACAALLAFQACVPDAPVGLDDGDSTPLPEPDDPAAPGSLTADLSTTGSEAPDTLLLSLDGAAPESVEAGSSWTWSSLPAGDYSVELDGVPGNCAVVEKNPTVVTVAAGASVRTDFTVICIATVGDLRVSAETSGNRIDDDGYRVELDGGVRREQIDVNGSVTFEGLAPGLHQVRLRDVDRHCDIEGDDRVEADVSVGEVVDVAYVLTCD
jgi:hypothetical protein